VKYIVTFWILENGQILVFLSQLMFEVSKISRLFALALRRRCLILLLTTSGIARIHKD
jgi:hypothetical protein